MDTLKSLSVDEILLLMYVNWSTNFSDLPFNEILYIYDMYLGSRSLIGVSLAAIQYTFQLASEHNNIYVIDNEQRWSKEPILDHFCQFTV